MFGSKAAQIYYMPAGKGPAGNCPLAPGAVLTHGFAACAGKRGFFPSI